MRARTAGIGLASLLAMLAFAPVASADSAVKLRKPSPEWYTQAFHERVLSAGADGVAVSEEQLDLACPGYAEDGVGAAGCIVAPHGCSANFVFTDGTDDYIGTARHCVGDDGNDIGVPLVMQVSTTTVATVGQVVKHTPGEGDVGEDFALIKLDPTVVLKWGLNPRIPVVGGPEGVYQDCATQTVKHYGHGYGAAVAQGYPRGGLATNWYDSGYGWTGHAMPGDSGSPVVLGDDRGAGNLTHIIVDFSEYFGSNTAGMRLSAILAFVGSGISVVNGNGSTSTSGATACGGDGGDEGGGGGNGGGKGGGNGGGKGGDKGNKGGGGNGNKKEKTALL